MSGICYIVGTPIGNLKDITLRALDTLKAVDVIASEDTRKSAVLLNAYGIKKPMISYHKHNEREGAEEIASLLAEGKDVALITDAGMPAISDPGAILVQTLRQKGFKVESVPGPTAVTSAVSLAGITKSGFAFVGFLPPKKKDRDGILDNLKNIALPLVFYCAPHDLDETLEYLAGSLGTRRVWAVKEITKMFETVYEGVLGQEFIENKKGEFVIIVDGAEEIADNKSGEAEKLLAEYIKNGYSRSQAVKMVVKDTKLPKNSVYEISLRLNEFAQQAGEDGSGD